MNSRKINIGLLVLAIAGAYVLWLRYPKQMSERPVAVSTENPHPDPQSSALRTNLVGDSSTGAQDAVFLNQVFPEVRGFFATLDGLGMNPLPEKLKATSCSKVRISHIPGGFICRLVIADNWTATYIQSGRFSAITHFGQRGADNPNRAISHADTNALRRLSQGAIKMPESEVWKIANRVADAFGINRSEFEKPEMFEEGLLEYRLGIYTVQYRKKGSDPINQLNYTRDFSFKATSQTTAVLVSYSHLGDR